VSARPVIDQPLNVLVVDDHDVVHWGLRIMLGRLPFVQRAWSARNGEEALQIATRHEIDLALIDLFVGAESGAEICERLHVVRPGLKVLLISGAGQISPKAAASCGASGFVTKDQRGAELVRAVRDVAMGRSVFEQESESAGPRPTLSSREREVLELLAAGATNKEIAVELQLSRHTVKEYTTAVYRKLQVRNRIQAARRGDQLGLID
jgi:DNA-binding NarL/FixJ family response regulator